MKKIKLKRPITELEENTLTLYYACTDKENIVEFGRTVKIDPLDYSLIKTTLGLWGYSLSLEEDNRIKNKSALSKFMEAVSKKLNVKKLFTYTGQEE